MDAMAPASMVEDFISHLSDRARVAAADWPQLESILADKIRSARATWPEIHVEETEFLQFIAHKLVEDDLPSALGELRSDELYLTCACARGNETAIAAFEKQFFGE